MTSSTLQETIAKAIAVNSYGFAEYEDTCLYCTCLRHAQVALEAIAKTIDEEAIVQADGAHAVRWNELEKAVKLPEKSCNKPYVEYKIGKITGLELLEAIRPLDVKIDQLIDYIEALNNRITKLEEK